MSEYCSYSVKYVEELEAEVELLKEQHEYTGSAARDGSGKVITTCLDRIKKQEAEIERLITRLKRCGIQYDKYDAEIERLRDVLESIAANTCCEPCQEAKLVAKAALKEAE